METSTNKKRKKKKSKFLLRRIIIVMALFLVLMMGIKGIGYMFKSLFKDDKISEYEPDTGYLISNETNVETSTEKTGDNSTSETNLTAETTQVSNEEVTNTSTTASETQTESSTAQTKTSQSGEVAPMNFQEVSYYLERFEDRYQAYHSKNADLTNKEVVRHVNMNLDYAFYENVQKSPDLDSVKVLCNKYFALPSDFTPKNLVDVPSDYYVNDGKAYSLNEDALKAFISMSDKAKTKGLSLRIISAYRSNSYQERLYEKYKANNGQADADRYSARPGHSEHETGYGIDINDVAQAFEKTDEFEWLQNNAHLYGFILRYPKGLDSQTGYMYEPWHYRYLGVELATKVHDSGLTYDAYYAMYLMK